MSRPVTCPACGTQFKTDLVVESSQDAYEAMVEGGMPVREYARTRGIAPATAMLYRRCGIAIKVVGVLSDSELFKRLANGATANRLTSRRRSNGPARPQKPCKQPLTRSPPIEANDADEPMHLVSGRAPTRG